MRGTHTYPVDNNGDYGRPVWREKPRGLRHLSDEQWASMFFWQVRAPDGSSCSLNPNTHRVTLNTDNTITVWPSIVTTTWHGWLKEGVWTSV